MNTIPTDNAGHRRAPRVVAAIVITSVIFCIGLVVPTHRADGYLTDLMPFIRGQVPFLPESQIWIWDYALPRFGWLLPCIALLIVYVLGALYLVHRENQRRVPTALLLWALCGTTFISILLLCLEQPPLYLLFTRSASIITGGYQHASTLVTDLGSTLRNWPQFILQYRKNTLITGGVALDPPGLTALYYAAGKLFDQVPVSDSLATLLRLEQCRSPHILSWTDGQTSSAWLQILMPLWVGLAVAPLYRLGTWIFGKQTARWSVVLWPIVPGLCMFIPRFNAFYPLITLVMLVFLWRGLERDNTFKIAVAGFAVSVATFLNLSLVPLGLLAGMVILFESIRNRANIRKVIIWLAVFGIASASVWAIYTPLSGITVVDILTLGLTQHFRQLDRPYLPWLILHPYDMYMFVGLPLTALVVWRVARLRRWQLSTGNSFVAASVVALILLTLSGTARGETGRVWLFLAPLWVLIAADMLRQLPRRQAVWLVATQTLCLLCMAAVLRVHATGLILPPAPAPVDQVAAVPVGAQFSRQADAVTLVGFTAETSEAGIDLHLHWRSDSWVKNLYLLSAVSVGPDHQVSKPINWVPMNWEYPLSCWVPGAEFVDTVRIPLPEHAASGAYWISLAISDIATHQPMLVNGQVQTGIGPIQVQGR